MTLHANNSVSLTTNDDDDYLYYSEARQRGSYYSGRIVVLNSTGAVSRNNSWQATSWRYTAATHLLTKRWGQI